MERERETSIACLPYTFQPGIKSTTFWYTERQSNQLSHPARTDLPRISREIPGELHGPSAQIGQIPQLQHGVMIPTLQERYEE